MSSQKEIKNMLERLNRASNDAMKAPARVVGVSAQTNGGTNNQPISSGLTNSSTGSRAHSMPRSEGKQVIIGTGIKMSSDIEVCENLSIEGELNGTLKDANVMDISAEGTFTGQAKVNEAYIHGRFDGKLIVRENLYIYAGSVVSGEITYNNIIAERGSEITGKISKYKGEKPVSAAAK